MTEHSPRIDEFKRNIREILQQDAYNSRTVRVGRHHHVYTCGERDDKVYFVESGQVKLLLLSWEGKECLTSVFAPGDIFGELCLCGQTERPETAVAMTDCTIKQIQSRAFLILLKRESLLEGLVQYLAFRVAEREQIITSLLTVNSEKRLAMTLLRLGEKFGKKDPRSVRIEQRISHIEQRISHEELAEMVGTTRPRVGIFLKKFRELGLIDLTRERHLIVRELKVVEYLSRLEQAADEEVDSSKSASTLDPELGSPPESIPIN